MPSEALPDGFAFPVAEYDHRDGFSITGGFVYRGQLLPELVGKYIFGDLQTGAIFYTYAELLERGTKSNVFSLKLFYCGRQTTLRDGVLGNDTRVDLRFGLGEDGEIYVLTKRNGMIRKILPHRN